MAETAIAENRATKWTIYMNKELVKIQQVEEVAMLTQTQGNEHELDAM